MSGLKKFSSSAEALRAAEDMEPPAQWEFYFYVESKKSPLNNQSNLFAHARAKPPYAVFQTAQGVV